MADTPTGRLGTIKAAVKMTAARDPKFVPIVLGTALPTFAILLVLGFVLDHPIIFGVLGLLTAMLVAITITGRRASSAAFAGIEGQPGAAAAVLQSMRGNWRVTPMVGFTRNQDLCHRVIGRAGVVLVAEGSPARAKELIGNEARRLRRIVGDTPIYDVIVGDGAGQVPLKRLQVHIMKLPRNVKPKDVNALDAKLKAISGPTMPIPKGPMPTHIPRGGKMR